MMATFVQVEPELLDRIRRDPSLTERLFQAELPGIGFDSERMRALILARGPQLLAGVLDQHPDLRAQLEQRVGHTQDAMRSGEGGEAILQLMQERLGPRPGGPLAGRHAELSLDKAWHGVHYLLCGSVEPVDGPLGQAVLGGDEIGEDFAGYGPARMHGPEAVTLIAGALGDPALESRSAGRYDPQQMAALEIYPFGWDGHGALDWLMGSLRDLRGFFHDAAGQGSAVVTCLV